MVAGQALTLRAVRSRERVRASKDTGSVGDSRGRELELEEPRGDQVFVWEWERLPGGGGHLRWGFEG